MPASGGCCWYAAYMCTLLTLYTHFLSLLVSSYHYSFLLSLIQPAAAFAAMHNLMFSHKTLAMLSGFCRCDSESLETNSQAQGNHSASLESAGTIQCKCCCQGRCKAGKSTPALACDKTHWAIQLVGCLFPMHFYALCATFVPFKGINSLPVLQVHHAAAYGSWAEFCASR